MASAPAITPNSTPGNKPESQKQTFEDFARGLSTDFGEAVFHTMQAFYQAWAKNELYHRGEQLITFDDQTGMWDEWTDEQKELYHVVNYVLPYVEMNAVEYSKSDPKYVAYTTSGDDRQLLAAVEQAQYIVDCLKETLWNVEDKQREGHVIQFRGQVYTRTYRDMFAKRKCRKPRFEMVDKKLGQDAVECVACGWRGNAENSDLTSGARGGALPSEADVNAPASGGNQSAVPPDASATPPMQPSPADQPPVQQPPAMSNAPCPQCGAPQTILRPAPVAKSMTQTGVELVDTWDVRSDFIDPFEVRTWDRSLRAEDSPFLDWERVELISKVKAEFKKARIGSDSSGGSNRIGGMDGLTFKRMLELSAGNDTAANKETRQSVIGQGFGRSNASVTDKLTCRRKTSYYEWYVYQDVMLGEDYTIPNSGKVIVAGVPLGQQFPEGLKIEYANDSILDVVNFAKNSEWSGYKYIVTGAGAQGIGIQNSLSLQDWANEMNSYQLTSVAGQANGITVVNGGLLKEGDIDMTPPAIVVVEDLLPGETLESALVHHKMQGPGVEAVGMQQQMKGDMQFILGARASSVTGLPGPEMDTARGVTYQENTSDAFAGMRLELAAWNKARRLEQALALCQKFEIYPVYRTKWGETKGKWLAGFSIPGDIKVRIERDSHQPRTTETMKRDFMAARGAGYGDPNTPPQIQRAIAKLFNQENYADQFDDWAMIGEKRLELIRDTLAQCQSQGLAPEEIMLVIFGGPAAQVSPDATPEELKMVPVLPGMKKILPDVFDNHAALVEFYINDFWLSDEGQKIDEAFDAVLHQLVSLHENALVAKAQQDAMKQMAAQAPVIDAQQGQKDKETASEDERSARTADREDARTERKHQHDLEVAKVKESKNES